MQPARADAAFICTIGAIFRTGGGAREMLAVAWKGVLALVVLLALDVVMSAALEDAASESERRLGSSGDLGRAVLMMGGEGEV